MRTHKAARALIHRPADAEGRPDADPYVHDEPEPAECGALHSCLWELSTLGSHYAPAVASIANLFAKPYGPTTTPIDIKPIAALSAGALMDLEAGRRLKAVPVGSKRPRALYNSPAGAFAEPE